MKISIIAAMGKNHVIGKNNQLPWHLPADLKHFKSLTMGKPIIMGKKTFESIGKALPGRHCIILTTDKNYSAPDCSVAHSIENALQLAGDAEEVMIIGGEKIYQQFLPQATRLYITLVEGNFNGDTWFPEWDPKLWHEIQKESHEADDRNLFPYTFLTLQRK